MNQAEALEVARSLKNLRAMLIDAGFQPDEADLQIKGVFEIIEVRAGKELSENPELNFETAVSQVSEQVAQEYYESVFSKESPELKLV